MLTFSVFALCVFVCVSRTPLGRARAWLRLALMQKRLADYLRLLITRKDLLRYSNAECTHGFLICNIYCMYYIDVNNDKHVLRQ